MAGGKQICGERVQKTAKGDGSVIDSVGSKEGGERTPPPSTDSQLSLHVSQDSRSHKRSESAPENNRPPSASIQARPERAPTGTHEIRDPQ